MIGTADTEIRGRGKSATAFRTISEVSEELDVPQHVLRFWETKFPQIKPLKRGGGRRYYRPDDVELLRRIKSLLHKEGYTIKGVQRLLKESRGQMPGISGGQTAPAAGGAHLPTGLFDRMDGADSAENDSDDAAIEPEQAELSPAVREQLQLLLEELFEIRCLLKG